MRQRWGRERERPRMQHHEPSRHALHVNISRSASTEITTLCVCVCGNLIHSLLANRGRSSILHSNQSGQTPYINAWNVVMWSAFTSCVFSFHMSEFSSIYSSISITKMWSEDTITWVKPWQLCSRKVSFHPSMDCHLWKMSEFLIPRLEQQKWCVKSLQHNNLNINMWVCLPCIQCHYVAKHRNSSAASTFTEYSFYLNHV